jgi:DNA-binding MarR family transcriptional regulator
MHCVLFALKRADQCSRALQRRLLNPYSITPARYDLLFVIFQRHVHRGTPSMFQSRLRKELGVTAPTVSRMSKSLAQLGLVTRKRERYGDRRQVTITLTKKAFALLRRVRKRVIEPGILWLALYTAMTSLEQLGSLEFYTNRWRAGLKDPAQFQFPDQRVRFVGKYGVVKKIPANIPS